MKIKMFTCEFRYFDLIDFRNSLIKYTFFKFSYYVIKEIIKCGQMINAKKIVFLKNIYSSMKIDP